MIDTYTAAAAWRMTNRTESERRETDEVTGRMVAAVHRLLRRSAQARPGRSPERGAACDAALTDGRVA